MISPLPRCLGAANATDMLPPSPRSASPERSGGRGAGGPTPASRAGPPQRAPRGGTRLRGRAHRRPSPARRRAAAPSKASRKLIGARAPRAPRPAAATRPPVLARFRATPPRPRADGSATPAASARPLRKWSRRRGRERPGRAVTGNAVPARQTVPNCARDPQGKRRLP